MAERLRDGLKKARVDVGARWVAAENLHVTLWFIGEVRDERAQDIMTSLSVPFPVPPFEVVLGGCGAFPPSGVPRVFWIGVDRGQQELQDLYAHVGERLAPLGYQPERREYSAHLTVARVKDASRGSAPAIRRMLAAVPAIPAACQVAAVTIFRSHLSSSGSTYEPLARVPLQG
jgi:2'-5' RNA ligase